MNYSVKILLPLLFLLACRTTRTGQSVNFQTSKGIFENLENGSKGSYAAGIIQLNSGAWKLDNALIGRNEQDAKKGKSALRMKPEGFAETCFDLTTQSATGAVQYATYGEDNGAALTVYYSTDGGAMWKVAGKVTATAHDLRQYAFTLPVQQSVRLRFVNTGTGRLNLDDIEVGGKVVSSGNTGTIRTTISTW